MNQRHAGRDRGARAGERGVGIAAHDHRIGTLGGDQLFQALLGKLDLLLAGARADAEVVMRARQARGEDLALGHRLVVVLAGVHEDLLSEWRRGFADRCGLDDLRAGPDHREHTRLRRAQDSRGIA